MITNRGVKVWPQGFEETFCTDHWRCRYEVTEGEQVANNAIPRITGASRGGEDRRHQDGEPLHL
jgi:isocitrate dehydrogenase